MSLMQTSFLRESLGQLSWQGAIAQLVERLVRNEKVRGSTPLSSTTSTHSIPLLAGGKKGSLLFSELFIQKNKPMLFRQSFHRWKFPALSD